MSLMTEEDRNYLIELRDLLNKNASARTSNETFDSADVLKRLAELEASTSKLERRIAELEKTAEHHWDEIVQLNHRT